MNEEESNLYYLEGSKLQMNPNDDVADLFKSFNKRFFWEKLKYVEVRWSPRMTLCAGLCVYKRQPGYCSIRLSKPLLSLRGKVDLVETLLHEMIHAFLFVTENNRDQDDHGPEFLKHMDRINKEVGLNISIYHTFHDEVKHYKQHVWLCNGPCRSRHPYFGKVSRAMNRAPGPTDIWWFEHKASCGGSFAKIAEPEGFIAQKKAICKKKEPSNKKNRDIRSFFKPVNELSPVEKKDTHLSDKHARHTWNDLSSAEGSKNAPESLNMENGGISKISNYVESTETVSNEVKSTETLSNEVKSTETLSNKVESEEHVSNSGSNNDGLSEESASDDEDTWSSSSDVPFFGIFGGIFNMPFRFLKRRAEDPDPKTIKIRKPDPSAISKSKGGMLKNLITAPDQPTLDSFYRKKMPSKSTLKSPKKSIATLGNSSQNARVKQSSVQSFFKTVT